MGLEEFIRRLKSERDVRDLSESEREFQSEVVRGKKEFL